MCDCIDSAGMSDTEPRAVDGMMIETLGTEAAMISTTTSSILPLPCQCCCPPPPTTLDQHAGLGLGAVEVGCEGCESIHWDGSVIYPCINTGYPNDCGKKIGLRRLVADNKHDRLSVPISKTSPSPAESTYHPALAHTFSSTMTPTSSGDGASPPAQQLQSHGENPAPSLAIERTHKLLSRMHLLPLPSSSGAPWSSSSLTHTSLLLTAFGFPLLRLLYAGDSSALPLASSTTMVSLASCGGIFLAPLLLSSKKALSHYGETAALPAAMLWEWLIRPW